MGDQNDVRRPQDESQVPATRETLPIEGGAWQESFEMFEVVEMDITMSDDQTRAWVISTMMVHYNH